MIEKKSYKKEKIALAYQTAAEVIMIKHFGYLVEGAHLYNDQHDKLVPGSRAEDHQTDHFIRNEKNPRSVSRGEVYVNLLGKKPKSYVYSQAFERTCENLIKANPAVPPTDGGKQYQQMMAVALSPLVADKLYAQSISFNDELSLAFYEENKCGRVEQCLEKIDGDDWGEAEKNQQLLAALNMTLKILEEQWQEVQTKAESLLNEGMI